MFRRVFLLLGLATCAWAGDLSGKITLDSSPGGRKVGQSKGSPGYEKGEVPPPSESEIENVVIYLEGKGLDCTPQTKMGSRNTFAQKNKEFLPHVLPVPKGSKVYFRNSDPFPHHVYSVSQPGAFEIAKHGSTVRSHEFEHQGEVEIFCGIHTKMNAYILVVDSDYYTTATRSGNFRIAGVPAGQYTLCVWHPRLPKPEKRSVTIPASGVAKMDLKL
jgi:plastocyanin